ncbi:hypothetical protein BpHYR1_013745 [Brachionus plicatilis]|uniref:Uncharacterized protein n=1 Tax=Brachionus plicatilis TaxID=10195 RepID=A0A3M7PA89_BRAPC|nr:hypothetical protein BpHYR1_013745 [Brachionus plicatilis]
MYCSINEGSKNSDGVVRNDPKEIAALLNKRFQSIFSQGDSNRQFPIFDPRTNVICPNDIDSIINVKIVYDNLNNLDQNKANALFSTLNTVSQLIKN